MEYIPAPSDIIHTIVTAPAESPSSYAIQCDRALLEDCRHTGRRTRLITASIAATALTRHEIFPDWDETILGLDDLALFDKGRADGRGRRENTNPPYARKRSCMRAASRAVSSSHAAHTQGEFNLVIEIWLGDSQGSKITSLAANLPYDTKCCLDGFQSYSTVMLMLLCEAAARYYFTSKKGVHRKRLQYPVELYKSIKH